MKVALMGRSLRGRFSGVVRYTHDLIGALAATLDCDLSVFVTQADDGLDATAIHRIRAPFPTPNEYARALWEQTIVPVEVHKLNPDVYHSPNYMLPIALRCPAVVTVHDLTFLDAEVHRLRSHLYLSLMTAIAVQKAARIICVSSHTRDRLIDHFPAVAPRTRVIGEGVSAPFRPQSRQAVERFIARHRIVDPYVLFVGTIEPRKNLARLIRAFESAVELSGSRHQLIIVGTRGWKDAPVQAAYHASTVRDRIRFIGYVPDEELPAAYSGAQIFAYPSLCEGFGLPPLEAMACGTPVLTSNVSSLPEVVGSAALTVDPLDESALAGGLVRLMTEPVTRKAFAEAGLMRAEAFRWDRVASKTFAVYQEAAG
ncbi:MAG: glycosyltransferase family 4 protein [Candidatus Dormibacteraeota bacterium]|nr:glycosyltransferase family 4 protein [Candidatus Dormibacteraeota bacterium]